MINAVAVEATFKDSPRERKRVATLQRIAEAGLRLFEQDGYDPTTLEAVAAQAGISARTLFYYFKTKYEILEYWQGHGFEDALAPTLLSQPMKEGPLDIVRRSLLELVEHYETDKSVIVDRIWNSTETLLAHKQRMYVRMEETVFECLTAMWKDPERQIELKVIAMVSIGALRLAMEAYRNSQDSSLAIQLELRFSIVKARLAKSPA